VHPDIQDWVVEELDEVLSDNVNSEMEYVGVFPRLKRVMAVMVRLDLLVALAIPNPPRIVEC
jgi:hypothetical protein